MNDLQTKSLFDLKDLRLAWERVNASVGTDSKDYFGISVYSTDIDKYLSEIQEKLTTNSYEPKRPFKYFEPKNTGTQRTKTVLRISDAIIYQAIADKVAFHLYDHLSETKGHIYGSVLNENVTKGAALLDEEYPDFYFFEYYVSLYNRFIEGINNTLELVVYKLETDITGFFDCIPHSSLILELNRLGVDKGILELLATCLNAWSGTRDMSTYHVGIPQGPAASFLFANIILDGLDRLIIDQGVSYHRFMDDIRIYGSSEKELLSMLVIVDRYLKGRSLCINTNKTVIQKISENVEEEEEYEDIFLDRSGIPLEDKIEDGIEHDIVIQDQTQSKETGSHIQNTSPSIAVKLYHLALKRIEDELLEDYLTLMSRPGSYAVPKHNVRKFLTLSQKWRITVKAIQSIQEYSPRDELVKVWLFGIRKLYWKANSMVWNLKCYDSLEKYYSDFESIISDFDRFEWVKYQVLNIYSKVLGSDKSKQQKAINDLESEESPLVRLGYYSILIDVIETDSQLFSSISSLLKQENEKYVKESVLDMVHRRHLNISISHLESWFL